MYLFRKIDNIIENIQNEISKPSSFVKGEEFERIAREVYFPEEFYTIEAMSHGYNKTRGRFIKEEQMPDLKLTDRDLDMSFYVECKYRIVDSNKYFNQDQSICFELSNKEQFKRFKELDKKTFVFYFLGIQLSDEESIAVHLFSIRDLISNYVNLDYLADYMVPQDVTIPPYDIWDKIIIKEENEGWCLRCREPVFTKYSNPFCYSCWEKWFKYGNFKYPEKYCFNCGNDSTTSASAPYCKKCHNYELKKYVRQIQISQQIYD